MKTKIFVLGVMLLSTGVYGTNCVEEDTFNMDMKRQPNVLIHTHTISYPKGSHHSLRTSPVMMAYAREMEKTFPGFRTYLTTDDQQHQSSEQK